MKKGMNMLKIYKIEKEPRLLIEQYMLSDNDEFQEVVGGILDCYPVSSISEAASATLILDKKD